MHILQPKHIKLKPEEAAKLLDSLNISSLQLPKISLDDPALPSECRAGDIVKIERKTKEGKSIYYRVVV